MLKENIKIIIVEDEILIAETIKFYLEKVNHEVLDICISYEEAVIAILLRKPDIVLIDLRLYGEKSGLDIAEFINKEKLNIPFIFLTSQMDDNVLSKAVKLKPSGYLSKPIVKDNLITTIQVAYHYSLDDFIKRSITISESGNTIILEIKDIVLIKSEHVYVQIFINNGKNYLYRNTLQNVQLEVPQDKFIQPHRSYLINIAYIKNYNADKITMSNGHVLSNSRYSKRDLTNLIHK